MTRAIAPHIRFDFDMTVRHTTWSLVIGGTFYWLTIMVNQTMVQRYISLPSKALAKRQVELKEAV